MTMDKFQLVNILKIKVICYIQKKVGKHCRNNGDKNL